MSTMNSGPKASNENEFPKWFKDTWLLTKRIGVLQSVSILVWFSLPMLCFYFSAFFLGVSFFTFSVFFGFIFSQSLRYVAERSADGEAVNVEDFFLGVFKQTASLDWKIKGAFWGVALFLTVSFFSVEPPSYYEKTNWVLMVLYGWPAFVSLVLTITFFGMLYSNASVQIRVYHYSFSKVMKDFKLAIKVNRSFRILQNPALGMLIISPILILLSVFLLLGLPWLSAIVGMVSVILVSNFSVVVVRDVFEGKDGLKEPQVEAVKAPSIQIN